MVIAIEAELSPTIVPMRKGMKNIRIMAGAPVPTRYSAMELTTEV